MGAADVDLTCVCVGVCGWVSVCVCVLLVNTLLFKLQVKSVKTGSIFWAIGCCLSYFYMVRTHTQTLIFVDHVSHKLE